VLKKSIAAATGGLQTVYKLAEAAEDELGAAAKTLTSQVGGSCCGTWNLFAQCACHRFSQSGELTYITSKM
jgi:hypothetical protein